MMERIISQALLVALLFAFAKLTASCNYILVASKCVNHIRTLTDSIDAVSDLAPVIAEDRRMEYDPYVQEIFGTYCRSLSSTARCIAEVAEESCPDLRRTFEAKLRRFVNQAPHVTEIMKFHPDCKRMVGTLGYLG